MFQAPKSYCPDITLMSKPSNSRKLILTCSLGALLSTAALTQQYSRGVLQEKYSPYTAVLMAEALKCVISLAYIVHSKRGLQPIIMQSKPMSLPALVYFVQNALGYWIFNTGISASEVSVLMQSKLLTTAVFRTIFLRQPLSYQKWRSLGIITVAGVMIAQGVGEATQGDKVQALDTATSSTTATATDSGPRNAWLGVIGCLVSALTSASAGVLLEYQYKSNLTEEKKTGIVAPRLDVENNLNEENKKAETTKKSEMYHDRLLQVAIKNFQLGIFSFAFGTVALCTFDLTHTLEYGIFHGVSKFMFFAALVMALAGLYVGLIIHELDAIFKNLATTIEIMLNTMISVMLFGKVLQPDFVYGTPIIMLSVLSYSLSD